MNDPLLPWHDFFVGAVTASAALLGLLFVVLSLHLRALRAEDGRELRSVARTMFLGYLMPLGIGSFGLIPQDLRPFGMELVLLVLVVTVPFASAARYGLQARGIGYDRRVTVAQFVAGVALVLLTLAACVTVALGDDRGLFLLGGIAVLSLLWGLFNTWELIFRIDLDR